MDDGGRAREIGQRLRFYREGRGWRVQDLSNESGVSMSTIVRYERGDKMRVDPLERLAEALNVSMGELFHDVDEPPRVTYQGFPDELLKSAV